VFVCVHIVGYTMDTMYFDSLENAVEVADDLQLPQFSLVTHKVIDCSMNYTSGFHPALLILYVVLNIKCFRCNYNATHFRKGTLYSHLRKCE